MAAPQANEVRAGLQGSAPHRGRAQPHDGQRLVANERAGRLAPGIAPAAWAGSRRWHKVTDRWPANGKVERASGPVRDLLGRGLGLGAGHREGQGLGDASIRSRLARTLEGGSTGLRSGQQLTGQGVPCSAQQGRPTHNALEAAWAGRAGEEPVVGGVA